MSDSPAARPHHRPVVRTDAFFEEMTGSDPAQVREAGELAATMLVRGVRREGDEVLIDRVVRLAETEGLEVLADIWSGSPSDSLAGTLWRLYLLTTWVKGNPRRVAEEFRAGRGTAQAAGVVAGVADPPGPEQVLVMVDEVLHGIVRGDFVDVLHRTAAFAHVVATGRAHLGHASHDETVRMLQLAEQLEAASRLESRGALV
ncbi:hypothetical protein [Nocardioides daphniae]|uniref:DNA-directed RNA polymerase subunit beta n=1 Tax=Nocardioides daphniae TaxID=402297 RepID=A0A4P7U8V4_9ACTN|nr:hypothetical protein [Nocardioides daphniae]QCC76532.1 hypothetical protein E2C04_03645 [Nocardioides daphniae]